MIRKTFFKSFWRGCSLELGFPWVWEQAKNFVEGTEDGLFSQAAKSIRRVALLIVFGQGFVSWYVICQWLGIGSIWAVGIPYLVGVGLGLVYYALPFGHKFCRFVLNWVNFLQYILLGGIALGLIMAIL